MFVGLGLGLGLSLISILSWIIVMGLVCCRFLDLEFMNWDGEMSPFKDGLVFQVVSRWRGVAFKFAFRGCFDREHSSPFGAIRDQEGNAS